MFNQNDATFIIMRHIGRSLMNRHPNYMLQYLPYRRRALLHQMSGAFLLTLAKAFVEARTQTSELGLGELTEDAEVVSKIDGLIYGITVVVIVAVILAVRPK